MRAASATNDQAMARFRELVHEGATEREIADELEGIYRGLGASGHSFDPIVSFGANAADPHHMPDDTKLKVGDVVLFDVGCRQEIGAYRSVLRAPSSGASRPPSSARCTNWCAAQTKRGLRSGTPRRTLLRHRQGGGYVIAEAGYGEYFTHRLGHQIGLDEHEPGDVSSVHDEEVQVGMCFSIEPGIYLPGEFGVRDRGLGVRDRRRLRGTQQLPPRACGARPPIARRCGSESRTREAAARRPYLPVIFSAASTTCAMVTLVVTVPIPPGTGVIASTTGSTSSKFTSPHRVPRESKLMPTSSTVCPAREVFLAERARATDGADDAGRPAQLGQVLGARMADGDARIAAQEHHRDGLAHHKASADNHNVLSHQGNPIEVENLHAARGSIFCS